VTDNHTLAFAYVADLVEPAALSRLLGQIDRVERSPLGHLGNSGATHERLRVWRGSGKQASLILKRVDLNLDITAIRSGDDFGREARLVQEPHLADVWSVFTNPYRACAVEPGQFGLLLDDLSDYLLPDVDEPITERDEDALLAALARLHAHYWNSDALALPWLVQPSMLMAALGPRAATDIDAPLSQEWRALLQTGWQAALERLPRACAELLSLPPDWLGLACEGLPRTLLHGDAKIANFALLPGGRVAAFDWAWMGAGPPTLDLGWYLAVNSARLARPKEAVITRYREYLEADLGTSLSGDVWTRLVHVGVLCGASMMLWDKARQMEQSPTPKANAEWRWWVDALTLVTRQASGLGLRPEET
jgi:hypothetical protein